jgi:hypothetical protein
LVVACQHALFPQEKRCVSQMKNNGG